MEKYIDIKIQLKNFYIVIVYVIRLINQNFLSFFCCRLEFIIYDDVTTVTKFIR